MTIDEQLKEDIKNALPEGLHNPLIVSRVASLMLLALQNGISVTPKDVVPTVLEELETYFNDYPLLKKYRDMQKFKQELEEIIKA